MKKLFTITLALAILVSFGATAVFAAPTNKGGPGDGTGYVSAAMELAMAEVLGMDPVAFAALYDSGLTFSEIALGLGYTLADLPGLMDAVRENAFASDPVQGTYLGGGYNAPDTAPKGTTIGAPAGATFRGGRR